MRALLLPPLLACGLLAFACRAASLASAPASSAQLPPEELAVVADARAKLEAGDARGALEQLAPLVGRHSSHVRLAILAQEARLAQLPADSEEEPAAALFPDYLERAESDDTALAWLLAARLAPSPQDARVLLERAARLDPRSAWVPYARAHGFCLERDFTRARSVVARALELEPGHAPSRRLWAMLLANAGQVRDAIDVLVSWLKGAETDPFIGPRERAEGEVDLASLLVLDREPEQALEVLRAVDPQALADPARGELVRAVASDEAGRPERALELARHAAELDPAGLLPLVHEAILQKKRGDAPAERAAWESLLARIEGRDASATEGAGPLDFQSLLLGLQAHARLERLARGALAEKGVPP